MYFRASGPSGWRDEFGRLEIANPKENRLSIKFPLRACAAAVAVCVLSLATATAQEESPQRLWRHGMSLFGDLKYPPGFKHFDYVNPSAPKGGAVRIT